ncbi:MAG: phosphoglycerate kinase [Bacteroidia bacterium]|jgi:phosphoglycerate kinase
MKTIGSYSFNGKRALIRVDFNVPLNADMEITDDTRMRAALPTIRKILSDGGSVVLMSHLGRPKNGHEAKFSLNYLVNHLSFLIGSTVNFGGDCVGDKAFEKSSSLNAGEVLLLDNLRFYKEETAGDVDFAETLAKHGDVYVNDAFGTAHRAHASTTIIAQFFPEEKMFGHLLGNEVDNLEKVLSNPEKPFTAIIGGAKVSSKISIITNLLDKVDNIIIGGGMAFTFTKAQGGKVGTSLVEDDYVEMAAGILKDAETKGVNILLPEDSVAADAFNNEANIQVCSTSAIPEGFMGLDIGPKAIEAYSTCLLNSKTILWNGPMGVFEMSSYQKGTKDVALAVAESTAKGAYSLVGGGDSVAAVNKFDLANKVSYVSTGGGAMLEYIEGKELPGVAAIRS